MITIENIEKEKQYNAYIIHNNKIVKRWNKVTKIDINNNQIKFNSNNKEVIVVAASINSVIFEEV